MSIRWISILCATWVVGAGLVFAQEEPAPQALDATIEQSPAEPNLATPALDDPPVSTDTMAAPVEPEPPTADPIADTAPVAASPQSVASAATSLPGPVTPAGHDERVRSIFILVSAVVLITTLIAIIVILLKRGRESRQEQRRYVADAFLRDVGGSTSQGMYKLGIKPIMLGRVGGKDTEFLDYIVVPSATIGRRHALIEFKDFGYWIMDQGSINGTFVNDRPVSAEMRLKHGDRIRLHKLEFEFVMPEVGESSVTVLAQDGARAGVAATASSSVQSDFVLDPEPDSVPFAGGDDLDELRESVESDEATLVPVSSSLDIPAGGSNDETLIPASGGAAETDETLLPAANGVERGKSKSSRNGNGKKGDEVFDITGGD